jgi:hypothetical protein
MRRDKSRAASHAGDPETGVCLCGVVLAGKPTWSAEDRLIADEVNCTRCRTALGLAPFSKEERLARRRSRRN